MPLNRHILNEASDFLFKFSRQVIVLETDFILHRPARGMKWPLNTILNSDGIVRRGALHLRRAVIADIVLAGPNPGLSCDLLFRAGLVEPDALSNCMKEFVRPYLNAFRIFQKRRNLLPRSIHLQVVNRLM